MRCFSCFAASSLLLAGLGLWTGCGGRPASPAGATTATQAKASDAADLPKLSPDDRKLADKQGVCPVSGEKLGSMGEPYKVVVKGRTVFLCCEGCKDDLLANPDKYLAKLTAADAKK